MDAFVAAGEAAHAALPARERDGFVRAVVDPFVNALHRVLLRGPRRLASEMRAVREALVARAVAGGPDALTDAERRVVLSDPDAVDALHEAVWALEDETAAARWGRPGGCGAPAAR